MPGGKSVITSYLHVLPKDVEELIAQQLMCAHPALFLPTARVLSGQLAWISSSGHTQWIESVALTPDGKWALTGSRDRTARLWDLEKTDSTSRVLSGHTDWIVSVSITPDGKRALTGSWDCTARLWDLTKPDSAPRVLYDHTDSVTSTAFTPDGKWALTGSLDKTARLWDLIKASQCSSCPL